MLSKENNKYDKICGKLRKHDADTGSTEVQIIRLSEDIARLTEHSKLFKKDFSSRRGLLNKVSRRKVYFNYLKKHDQKLCEKLMKELGIRKIN